MDKLQLVQLYRDNYGGKLSVKLLIDSVHVVVSLSFKMVKRLPVI